MKCDLPLLDRRLERVQEQTSRHLTRRRSFDESA